MAEYVEELAVRGYWKCNILAHRHRMENAAEVCLQKRGGAKAELRRIRRNLRIITGMQQGQSLSTIAIANDCSPSNLTKAVNSSLILAYRHSAENGGCPFKRRAWSTKDFSEANLVTELMFLVKILEEYAATLI